MNAPDKPILRIDKLTVDFLSEGDPVRAVDDVSFDVCPGETLVILGESGSGKSVSTGTVMGVPRSEHRLLDIAESFERADPSRFAARTPPGLEGRPEPCLFKLELPARAMLLGLPASAEEIVRISGWGGSEVAIVNGLLTNVLAEKLAEEGIRVKYEPVDGDYSQFIINGLSAGTAPDLFYVDTFWARSVFSAGQAAPVTNDVSGFAANLLTAFTYDGKLYSIPKDFNTLAIHFNKDIFDDAGVGYPSDDDTWTTLQEKLVAVNKSLPEVDGLCVVPEYARFGAFALSTGWSPFDARGKTVLDKRFRRAFDFYTGLVKSGAAVMAADAGHSWTGGCLASERAAVAIEGAWILSALRDSAPNMAETAVRSRPMPSSNAPRRR